MEETRLDILENDLLDYQRITNATFRALKRQVSRNRLGINDIAEHLGLGTLGVYRVEIDLGGDSLIDVGETKIIRCYAYDGWLDVSSTIVKWKVVRDSGEETDDMVWNNDHKDFSYRTNPDNDDKSAWIAITLADLNGKDKVRFTFTAYFDEEEFAETELDFINS